MQKLFTLHCAVRVSFFDTGGVLAIPSADRCFEKMAVNRLVEEARIGKAGTLAGQISRLEVVVLDELGYMHHGSAWIFAVFGAMHDL